MSRYKIFGSGVYVRQKHDKKIAERSTLHVYLGPADEGTSIFAYDMNSKRVFRTVDVRHDESIFPLKQNATSSQVPARDEYLTISDIPVEDEVDVEHVHDATDVTTDQEAANADLVVDDSDYFLTQEDVTDEAVNPNESDNQMESYIEMPNLTHEEPSENPVTESEEQQDDYLIQLTRTEIAEKNHINRMAYGRS